MKKIQTKKTNLVFSVSFLQKICVGKRSALMSTETVDTITHCKL